jgi:tetrahydromethanopterin S-methyltransferase subunit A
MNDEEEIKDTQEYVTEEEPGQKAEETLVLSVSQAAEAEVDAEEQ